MTVLSEQVYTRRVFAWAGDTERLTKLFTLAHECLQEKYPAQRPGEMKHVYSDEDWKVYSTLLISLRSKGNRRDSADSDDLATVVTKIEPNEVTGFHIRNSKEAEHNISVFVRQPSSSSEFEAGRGKLWVESIDEDWALATFDKLSKELDRCFPTRGQIKKRWVAYLLASVFMLAFLIPCGVLLPVGGALAIAVAVGLAVATTIHFVSVTDIIVPTVDMFRPNESPRGTLRLAGCVTALTILLAVAGIVITLVK